MKQWYGAAAMCINEKFEILMVLQGKPEETKTWSIPSGGKETGESFEACCIREVKEETGYDIKIVNKIHKKTGCYKDLNIQYEIEFFEVKIISGHQHIQDPDHLIHEIAWKSESDLANLSLSYPEDRVLLEKWIQKIQQRSGEK